MPFRQATKESLNQTENLSLYPQMNLGGLSLKCKLQDFSSIPSGIYDKKSALLGCAGGKGGFLTLIQIQWVPKLQSRTSTFPSLWGFFNTSEFLCRNQRK